MILELIWYAFVFVVLGGVIVFFASEAEKEGDSVPAAIFVGVCIDIVIVAIYFGMVMLKNWIAFS